MPTTPERCPSCGRIMSYRERFEQGECNDCYTANPASVIPMSEHRDRGQ